MSQGFSLLQADMPSNNNGMSSEIAQKECSGQGLATLWDGWYSNDMCQIHFLPWACDDEICLDRATMKQATSAITMALTRLIQYQLPFFSLKLARNALNRSWHWLLLLPGTAFATCSQSKANLDHDGCSDTGLPETGGMRV